MSKQPLSARVFLQVLLLVVVVPLLPLLISWRWSWWEAWTYVAICVLGFVVSRLLAARRNPGLLAERARFLREGQPAPFDRVLAPLLVLGGLVLPLVAGLEARFGPGLDFSLAVKVVAVLLIVAGYALASYALVSNPFFSGTVRIQGERGHRVVTAGPYRWVRHPGYAGGLLSLLLTPLLLDSCWALVPALLLAAASVLRTALEDQFLQEHLEGYREYARRVRYRLLPGIW